MLSVTNNRERQLKLEHYNAALHLCSLFINFRLVQLR